jgi:hypothetical protein
VVDKDCSAEKFEKEKSDTELLVMDCSGNEANEN